MRIWGKNVEEMLITEKKSESQAGNFWEGYFQRQTGIFLRASSGLSCLLPRQPWLSLHAPAPPHANLLSRTAPHQSNPKEGASEAAFPEVFLSISCCRQHLQVSSTGYTSRQSEEA